MAGVIANNPRHRCGVRGTMRVLASYLASCLVLGVVLAASPFVAAASAANAVISVTTTADTVDGDDGVLSVREAVALANQQVGPDTIDLAAGAAYTLTRCGVVPGGVLDATDVAGLTVRGGGSSMAVCASSGFRFSAGSANVSMLTLTGPGGGMSMVGTTGAAAGTALMLDQVTIDGAARDCVLVTGRAKISLRSTNLRNCGGSGLAAPESGRYGVDAATLDSTEITGTHAGAGSIGDAYLGHVSVHHNVGGGLSIGRQSLVSHSHFDHNSGGVIGGLAVGLTATSLPFSRAEISNSTFDDNTATTWGGLVVRADLKLLSSSASRNSVADGVGGIALLSISPSSSSYHEVSGARVDDNVATNGTGGMAVGSPRPAGSTWTDRIRMQATLDRNVGSRVSALELMNAQVISFATSVRGNEVTGTPDASMLTSGTVVMGPGATVTMVQATIADNVTVPSTDGNPIAGGIGGIGTANIILSTITGNRGDVGGVQLAATGSSIDRSTIADNIGTKASQLLTRDSVTVSASALGTSTVSAVPVCRADGPAAAITSAGFAFDSGHSCGFGNPPAGTYDVVDGGDPQLGPLRDTEELDDGPVAIRRPGVTSPLVDRIPRSGAHCSTTSGPWMMRGPACDIGPVEGSTGARFHPVAPMRILDSRTSNGGWYTPLVAGVPRSLKVTGLAVPASASAVVVNVTVTGSTAPSFLTVYPAGQPTPTASNLNFAAGQTIPNLVTTQVGAGGAITFATAAGTTNVIADLVGWFDDGSPIDGSGAGDRFTPVTPARLLDSRTTNGGWNSKLTAATPRDLLVGGRGGVPTTATAAVVNITATASDADTFVTVWPKGQGKPITSNLNVATGQTIPNLAVVPLGADKSIRLATAHGQLDVVVDVVGYYDPTSGSVFHPVPPLRRLDDRINLGAIGPWGPAESRPLSWVSNATAIVANVTATNATTGTFITAYPHGAPVPTASNLNVGPGQTIPNLVVVGVEGVGEAYDGFELRNAHGSVDLIADLNGYYTST